MPAVTKKDRRIKLQLVANKDHSVSGGLIAVEAMAQHSGLWDKLRLNRCLDPRKDRSRGYSAEVIAGQILYALCSGGTGVVDAERLNDNPLAKELFGVEKFADESQVGEWMRAQNEKSLAVLQQINRDLVQWICTKADRRRWLHAGQREIFFDDTQLEVSGKKFEGAKINYEGNLALSWQTLWLGMFLLDGHVGSPGDCSDQLAPMLENNRAHWRGQEAHCYTDSGSSAGKYLEKIAAEGWHYTVSYNRWTGPLEKKAQELPPGEWKKSGEEEHAFFRYQPEGCASPKLFACARQKKDLFYRYGFVVCDEGQKDAGLVFERHHLKGDKEKLFSEVLSGLDLHHPPCASLQANRIFYALAMIAYNLLMAIKVLELPDDCQGWRLQTLLKQMVYLPTRLMNRSRQVWARLMVPAHWLEWWRKLLERMWPRPGPGRPALQAL
jgi:hypothetical protein